MDISEEEELEVAVKKNVEDLNEIVCTTTYLIECYYNLYLNKVPCMNSKQTGYIWLMEVLQGNDKRCQRIFRMEKDICAPNFMQRIRKLLWIHGFEKNPCARDISINFEYSRTWHGK